MTTSKKGKKKWKRVAERAECRPDRQNGLARCDLHQSFKPGGRYLRETMKEKI